MLNKEKFIQQIVKIALLVQRFPGGGAEHYVKEIATRLHKLGKDVTVITSKNLEDDDTKYGFRIIRLPSSIKIGEYLFWKGLKKILEEEKFDIVHTNTYGYYHSDRVARLKSKMGFKLVMTSHGFTGMDLHKLKKEKVIKHGSKFDFLREFYDNRIGKKTILLCDHLIALSKYDSDYYKSIGVHESKISIIPPGVSDIFFDEGTPKLDLEGDPILLSVGQLSWIKNQEMMILAMSSLLKTKPNAHLYLLGPDLGELSNLNNLCKKLRIGNHVTFLGAKPKQHIPNYMKSADLFLQTSYAEGLSTVLLEATVSGLPFITTPAGGNRYLEHLGNGKVIQFNDVESLTKNIKIFLDDPEIKNKIKIRKKCFDSYNWSAIFKKIHLVYTNLLK